MAKEHHYSLTVQWTDNNGAGTTSYRAYGRTHTILVNGKVIIVGSADPAFLGDQTKHNPEDLLVAALSACHMLSYLYVCSIGGVVVVDYTDHATGTMVETPDGGGHFTEVTLHPVVTVKDASMVDKANELHHKASK